ncbi:MAG: hypothetical protein AB8C84_03400 [Oligoflexales bacterium]
MPTATIVNAPNAISNYGRIRDEYGQEYTVHGSDMPAGGESGDDYAYYVDLWQYSDRNVTTLRSGTYGPEG